MENVQLYVCFHVALLVWTRNLYTFPQTQLNTRGWVEWNYILTNIWNFRLSDLLEGMWGQASFPSSVGEAVRLSGTPRTVSPLLALQTFSRALAHLRSSRRGRQTSVLTPRSQPRGRGRRAPTSIIPSESVHSVSDPVDKINHIK